jgi:hypothetical protein
MNCNTQNKKIAFITEKTLIIGIDVGSQTHYARAFDWRNFEYSRKAFAFSNDEDGFEAFKNWMDEIATKHHKDTVIPGMEPTGHYWFNLGAFLQNQGMRVVHVNPHHVKKSKELDDNNPRKIFISIYSDRNLCGNKKFVQSEVSDTRGNHKDQESDITLV